MSPTTRKSSVAPRAVCLTALAFVAALAFAPSPASAGGPVGLQANAGWYTEADEFFIGAGARFGLTTVTFVPNAEWLFVSGGSAYTLNLDGHMSVLPMGVANGYVGAGVGWSIVNPDGGSSQTDTVVNLIAGAGLNAVPLKPFAQFKWVVADGNDPLEFSIGARF